MTDSSSQPPTLHTSEGEYPLHHYHLALAGREWTVLHTGVILTWEDEHAFFRDLMNQLPYGVALWPSAIALAHALADEGDSLRGKTVLELGAGTGLPGIVAASLGATVVQTDRQELAMTVCQRNAELNSVAGVTHRLVDWTDWQETQRFDWIIGSDVLYGDPLHPHLQTIFLSNLAPGGTVLLSDPFRNNSIRFLETLQAQGWNVAVSKWTLGEDVPRPIGVFALTLPT